MKPRIAVYKFSSCDGCQLAFLDNGEALLTLANLVDIVHFAEAGPIDIGAEVDIAFVEGSISTPEEEELIKVVREKSKFVVAIGACAVSGGLQALRNISDADKWIENIYAIPEYIESLETATPISEHIKVDFELWGCPINPEQLLTAVRSLLFGVMPADVKDSVCLECKRQGNVCTMVTKDMPCMGPVTKTGCGALCPSFGRDCYGCFGPSENPNTKSLTVRLEGLGLLPAEVARRFLKINNYAPEFAKAGKRIKKREAQKAETAE